MIPQAAGAADSCRQSGRISRMFAALAEKNRTAFIAYITGGDPDMERSFRLAKALSLCGVDLLEIGVPFSDPLADGPTIQAAAGRALASGASLPLLLARLKKFRNECDIPVVLFSYLNPIYVYGYERFFKDAAASGADGVLILDLPPDEASRNAELARGEVLDSIRLIAPTTPQHRLPEICDQAEGFVYYVSREGVTGEQKELAGSVGEQIALIRNCTSLPIAVGFGISNAEQAATVAKLAEGVVVGSAIVRRIAEHANTENLEKAVCDFVRPIAEAVHSV